MRQALGTAALALALAATATLFDAEALWVPAVALGALVVGCVAWVCCGAYGVRIRRVLGARRVVEGQPLVVELEIRGGPLRLPTGRVIDPLLTAPVPLPAGRRGALVRIEARFERRGRHRLAATAVMVCDPLGLAARSVLGAADPACDEVLVLPRIEPVVAAARVAEASYPRRRARPVAGAEVEFDGVRGLREGTPASRIFWPSVARGGEAQERRLAADGGGEPLLLLDPRGADSDEDLDAAVRATASLAVALGRAGGCRVLLPGDRRATALGPSLGGWPRVHARLALVTAAGRLAPGAIGQRHGAVVYVSADPRRRSPHAALSSGPSVLVVPGKLAGSPAAFTVAGCHGYELSAGARRPAHAVHGSASA